LREKFEIKRYKKNGNIHENKIGKIPNVPRIKTKNFVLSTTGKIFPQKNKNTEKAGTKKNNFSTKISDKSLISNIIQTIKADTMLNMKNPMELRFQGLSKGSGFKIINHTFFL
jgi:hypothetical protein